MPTNIFINYRKDDSLWNTQALYNELQKYFPKESIFKDFNTIGLGDDYVHSINKALEQCSVLLVIIGKNWLEIKNENGTSRLSDPGDLVRIEIATALKRNIKVIPVFFDDVKMFKEHQLPDDLQALTRRQSITVHDTKFDADIQKLADAVNSILGKPIKPPPKRESDEIILTPKSRVRIAIIVAIIAFLISAVGILISISTSNRSTIPMDVLSAIAIAGGIAAVCWFLIGLITGPDKKRLLLIIASSLIVLLIFLAVSYRNYKDVNMGIAFIMSPAGLLVAIIAWLIQKLQVRNVK